jgi:GNAT superfamily N-acetyltransferase
MAAGLSIRPATADDRGEYVSMRRALWPDADPRLIEWQMEQVLDGDSSCIVALVADRGDGSLGGLLEVRTGVTGAPGTMARVASVAAWYVDADLRRRGVGSVLMEAGTEWARARRCTEISSDCEEWNDASRRAHWANGFKETHRQIFFTKVL